MNGFNFGPGQKWTIMGGILGTPEIFIGPDLIQDLSKLMVSVQAGPRTFEHIWSRSGLI